jgi:hypothetical protein
MGDEDLTSTAFLATVKENGRLKEGLVHLVQKLRSGVEVRASSRLTPEKGGGPRRGSGRES